MRIGIGLGAGPDPAKAARDAVRQALKGAPKPTFALAFAGVKLDQKAVHAELCRRLDPSLLIGASSYAEVTPAGVSRDSVAVLLLEAPGLGVRFAGAEIGADLEAAGAALADAANSIAACSKSACPVGLVFSGSSQGRNDGLLRALHERLPGVPFFGGLSSGDYDAGMDSASFWRGWQYDGRALGNARARLALLELPGSARVGFGFEHGWRPVGPPTRITKAEGGRVKEIDGVRAVDWYRQFFGEDAPKEVLMRSIQRHGFALLLEGDYKGKSLLKLPVRIDFRAGWIDFYPSEDLHGRTVQLIAATRSGVLEGARAAAKRALKALDGRKPSLVLAVSCCTRGRFLNSRIGQEMRAAREVFGEGVPVFGYYSGGELLPFLSRYEQAADRSIPFGGSHYHATTVGFLALSFPGRVPVKAPKTLPRVSEEAFRAEALRRSEADIDDIESFMGNLSRKTTEDGEKLRQQTNVIRRYTPHGVWRAVGARAARGVYELKDAAFDGAFLFMDVKGFTSYSEKHTPVEVVRALNGILGPATDLIHACGGDVDKYVGDCIFAAFRRPEDAVEAGRRVLNHVAKLAAEGGPFTVRIGVNAGRAVRANVGSGDRREYTYIGDAVNLAQRLESNATPGAMLVSAAVYKRVKARWPEAPSRRFAVKGKAEPVLAYELR